VNTLTRTTTTTTTATTTTTTTTTTTHTDFVDVDIEVFGDPLAGRAQRAEGTRLLHKQAEFVFVLKEKSRRRRAEWGNQGGSKAATGRFRGGRPQGMEG
jgi:hypothetical protein